VPLPRRAVAGRPFSAARRPYPAPRVPCPSGRSSPGPTSDPLEGVVRTGRQVHLDAVAWPDRSPVHDDGHDAGFADDIAVVVACEEGLEQARTKSIDLHAGLRSPVILMRACSPSPRSVSRGSPSRSIPAVRTFSPSCPGATSKPCSHSSTCNSEWSRCTLAQVRLGGIRDHPTAVLHGAPGMRIALHSQPGQQDDLVADGLAEAMVPVAADRHHRRALRQRSSRPG
jgi:hypothetical protein